MITNLVLETLEGETYIILPDEILASAEITIGTEVDVSAVNGRLVIKKSEPSHDKADEN